MIGENLKRFRKNKGLTRMQLADKLDVAEATVYRYESNQREPRYSMLTKIAEVLEISTKELMDCEDIKTNNLAKLQRYYEQKKWEYENIDNEHNIGNEGLLKGLEIAIKIMNER